MLSGIDPILTGELLAALDRLGHGELVVVADANFPAYRTGARVVETPGLAAPAVARAIRTVTPLDEHEGPSVALMATPAGERTPVQLELVEASAAPADRVLALERFAFYELAGTAGLVVRTGETRPYGNLAIRKGVVRARGAETGA